MLKRLPPAVLNARVPITIMVMYAQTSDATYCCLPFRRVCYKINKQNTKHKTQQLVTVNSQFGKCKLMRLLYFPAGKQQHGKYKLEQS